MFGIHKTAVQESVMKNNRRRWDHVQKAVAGGSPLTPHHPLVLSADRVCASAKLLWLMLLGLIMFVPSIAAHAQTQWTVLIIHGRFDPSTGCEAEQYGTFDYDQGCVWNAGSPTTSGKVLFVNWDAWNNSFDDTTWPGGEAVVQAAVVDNCNVSNNQFCSVICHSAGCAAIENFIAGYSDQNVINAIENVLAAESAAGGSELANDEESLPSWMDGVLNDIWGSDITAPIDQYLTTSYARSAYDHNNMQYVPIRGLAGTGGENGAEGDAEVFPTQDITSSTNPNCQTVFFDSEVMCSDLFVALHSTGAHSRVASFQDANSTLEPYDDTAGTYDFHGWWIGDSYNNAYDGPFSSQGKSLYDSTFHTYNITHTEGKQLAVEEYSACNSVVGTNEFYCW
jgi:hypothetical protein